MEELMLEVKKDIIEALNLEDMTPEDLGDAAPLFGDDGLGLDSIDALELIVLLEKKYGIKLQDPKDGRKVFKSVRVMSEFIQANRTK
jgi:acyl carrier protein